MNDCVLVPSSRVRPDVVRTNSSPSSPPSRGDEDGDEPMFASLRPGTNPSHTLPYADSTPVPPPTPASLPPTPRHLPIPRHPRTVPTLHPFPPPPSSSTTVPSPAQAHQTRTRLQPAAAAGA